jgi:DNA-binding beta-propeller fold protein YncE
VPTGDDALTIVNEATCNATVRTGCGQTPPTVTVGNASNLEGLAVNPATDTIYVVNTGDDTISVISRRAIAQQAGSFVGSCET